MHLVQTADTLFLARTAVQNVRTCVEATRVSTDEGQTTYEGVGSDLERQSAERISSRSITNCLITGRGVSTNNSGYINGRRQVSDDAIEQQLYTFIFKRRTAEHGDELHRAGSFTDCLHKLLTGNRVGIGEEFLHQSLVLGSNLLDKFVTPLLCLGLHLGGNLFELEVIAYSLVIVVDDSVHVDKVYKTNEFVLRTDRQYKGKGISTQTLFNLCANVHEVCTGTVHFVNVTDTGHIVFVGLTPYGLTLGLYATYCTEGCNSTVQHTQRTLNLNGEVNVSGGVDKVDLVLFAFVVPEGGSSSRSDGDTTLLLLNHPVHGSRTVVSFTDFVSLTCVEQNSLRGSGFAGIDVSHDADITSIC